MAERLRLFAFGVQNGLVLFVATMFVVAIGLIVFGYWWLNGFRPPTGVEVGDAAILFNQAIAVLNANNTWSNVFFLATQTCLVFVAVHLTKYLYGRRRVIDNVTNNVNEELAKVREKVTAVLTDARTLGAMTGITYLRELNDPDNGQNQYKLRLGDAKSSCEIFDAHCRNLAEYVSKLEIPSAPLLNIAASADAAAEALNEATGVWKLDSYLAALAKGKPILEKFLKAELKLA